MKKQKQGLKILYDLLLICNHIFHHQDVVLKDVSEMNDVIC